MSITPTITLKALEDDALLERVRVLANDSRRIEADLIAHLAEVDVRGLLARRVPSSLFGYCRETLNLSECEAYLRITVARASRRHPMLLEMLADGRLHLTGAGKLAPHLTLENRDGLLARATHQSKRRIEELIAEISPQPDVPARIRKLPTTQPAARQLRPDAVGGHDNPDGCRPLDPRRAALAGAPQPPSSRAPSQIPVAAALASPPLDAAVPAAQVPPLAPVAPAPVRSGTAVPARISPLAPARFKVQFTASAELREKLVRLQELMRPGLPGGDLAAVIEAAVTEKLERLEARRYAQTRAPRKTLSDTNTSPISRTIPAAVRRKVYERDGGRCTFVDAQGRRCTERHRLEFHHAGKAWVRGGDHSVGNVRLACIRHHQHLTDQEYGREWMDRCRRSGATGAPRASSPG